VDHTKGLKGIFNIVIGQLDGQITYKNGTDIQVSGGDRYGDVAIEEGGSLEQFVTVLSGLGCNTHTAVSQELNCFNLLGVKGSQQLWCNIGDSLRLVDLGRKMENNTLWKRHLCKIIVTYQYVRTIPT